MENDYVRYQHSIASEFLAIKDRVRFLIQNKHWGEDGRYKEIILINYLRKILPDNVAVGTGFVKGANEQISSQIDIIVYKKNQPSLFREGDFVVLMSDSVIGIIEVKSKVTSSTLTFQRATPEGHSLSTIEKCNRNGEIIGNRNVFNGIFSYESPIAISKNFVEGVFGQQIIAGKEYLNHICFNQNIFVRLWQEGNPRERCNGYNMPTYSFYNLSYKNIFHDAEDKEKGLAFGYFISNLLETVFRFTCPEVLSNQYYEFLYPLEHTKEDFRFRDCDIRFADGPTTQPT